MFMELKRPKHSKTAASMLMMLVEEQSITKHRLGLPEGEGPLPLQNQGPKLLLYQKRRPPLNQPLHQAPPQLTRSPSGPALDWPGHIGQPMRFQMPRNIIMRSSPSAALLRQAADLLNYTIPAPAPCCKGNKEAWTCKYRNCGSVSTGPLHGGVIRFLVTTNDHLLKELDVTRERHQHKGESD
ncbi:hypothetical protein DPMN_047749 [Dreissena polymorpha]|uniref:Uncharacterized protein n=1 Tax=Dreissena polymorpha TaxID=45954 RepID=A0A9D4D8A4_DREPO|nr:hypothetical protein DPMN_047749 [Dreissena polymorpha]